MSESKLKKRRSQASDTGTMEGNTVCPPRRPKLLTYEEIQEWSRDNKFIRTGYRPEKPDYKDMLLSLTYVHNETCNIYTHLIGAILVWPVAYIYMRILPEPQYDNVLPADYVMFIIFFFSCEFCLLSSATYHLMQPHSHEVEQFWHRMDLTGIAVIIAGTFIAAIYYFFICQPAVQILHWVITIVSGSACVALISITKFRTLRWRTLRVVAFFLFGLSAFVPLLHGVGLHGSDYMFAYMGMKWY
ncbi:HlyIII-domain-containing protein [Cadophora sp. DSE1049]|nr:HlyIII-domain-containing protein [Cadophora sp. DSE1049]